MVNWLWLFFAMVLTGCGKTIPESRMNVVHTSQPTVHAASRDIRKAANMSDEKVEEKVVKTNLEWRKSLTPEQYHILREKGTERAFTGKFWNNHDTGMYTCAACGLELFSSATKFDSGTGWPSFWDAVGKDRIRLKEDNSYGMARTEVECARCGGHLGHLFEDGPNPTGQRYCINSASLEFKKE